MGTPVIKQRRSYVANRVPLTTDLQEGQIAINAAMQGIWTKNAGGQIVQLGVKPSDLATVATSGDYNDLINKPNTTGALLLQGAWDASANNPTIPAAAAGNKSWYYVVSTAGSTNIDGNTIWNVGDWLVSDGTKWNRIAISQPIDPTANISFGVANGFMDNVDYIFTRQCTFALNFGASKAKFTLASGTTASVDLRKNGVSVGTISYSSGTVTYTSVSTGNTVFSPGDVLTFVPTTSNITAFTPNVTGQWKLN